MDTHVNAESNMKSPLSGSVFLSGHTNRFLTWECTVLATPSLDAPNERPMGEEWVPGLTP